jgi:aminopeptidase
MPDPRITEYARLLVEHCVDVQPGWQVLVTSSPLARPLVEEVVSNIAKRGAYALPRIVFGSLGIFPAPTSGLAWVREAPEELLGEMSPIDLYAAEHIDASIQIGAPENVRDGSDLSQERMALLRKAGQPYRERTASLKMPWVYCQFPTPALAQEAHMTLDAYEDFLYGACLLNWEEEGRKMRRLADRFDQADTVRIVGEGTDLTLSVKGRHGQVGDGHFNMPDGEFFYSPVEDASEGVITFSEFPAIYGASEVEGARLVFKEGRVVEASAKSGEDFLIKTLDSDPGARVLGELGIGCNPGIQKHMKNTLFDEKINGTIHLAVGNGFPFLGSKNKSNVHWDMVKDLRQGGQLFCDGELVQESGEWKI